MNLIKLEIIWKNISLFLYQLKKVNNYDGNDGKNEIITYKLKFIDSFRFMPDSLSNLVDNISGIFNSMECKPCIEKIKTNSECYFVGLIYKCEECKEEWKRSLNKLIESFPSVYQFYNGNLN